MAKANPSAEPSMEEILASIRRIISDEGESKPSAPAPAANDPVAEETHVTEDDLDRLFSGAGDDEPEPEPEIEAEAVEDADVLELDEGMEAADEGLDIVEGLRPDEADVTFADPEPDLVGDEGGLEWDDAEAEAAAFEMEPEPAEEPEPVVVAPEPRKPEARRQEPVEDEEPLVSAATGATVNAAFGQLTHTILAANARTLDDLVKEMLRPMLKAWLDENLPSVVERLVRAEIERVSRGR